MLVKIQKSRSKTNSFHHRSINEIICHGIPDNRPLEEGDIVNLDISVYYKGMHADLNETFAVGKVDDASLFLVYSIIF